MPVNFSNFQQLPQQPSEPITKWNPKEMPQFVGIYAGVKEITWNGDKFLRIQFKNVVNNTTDAPVEGILSCKDYAGLKRKLGAEMIGKRLGVAWEGEKPHPKYPAKTMNVFSICILPDEVQDKDPF